MVHLTEAYEWKDTVWRVLCVPSLSHDDVWNLKKNKFMYLIFLNIFALHVHVYNRKFCQFFKMCQTFNAQYLTAAGVDSGSCCDDDRGEWKSRLKWLWNQYSKVKVLCAFCRGPAGVLSRIPKPPETKFGNHRYGHALFVWVVNCCGSVAHQNEQGNKTSLLLYNTSTR